MQRPLYAEECYFQVAKPYKKGNKQKIYLVHNRNFDLSQEQFAFYGMALQDYVHGLTSKRLKPTFDKRIRQDGQTIYVLRFQSKRAVEPFTVWIDPPSSTAYKNLIFSLGYDYKTRGYLPDRLSFGAGGNLSAKMSIEY